MAFTVNDLNAALQGQPVGNKAKSVASTVGGFAKVAGRSALDTLPVTRRAFKKEMAIGHERDVANNIAIQKLAEAFGVELDWEEIGAEAAAFMAMQQAVPETTKESAEFLGALKGIFEGMMGGEKPKSKRQVRKEQNEELQDEMLEILVDEETGDFVAAPEGTKGTSNPDLRFGFDA